jgi:hypothetical protein
MTIDDRRVTGVATELVRELRDSLAGDVLAPGASTSTSPACTTRPTSTDRRRQGLTWGGSSECRRHTTRPACSRAPPGGRDDSAALRE